MRLIADIQAALTPDLLKPRYRTLNDASNPTAGHCYHAAEALWHALGGKAAGWTPQVHREPDGITHWWLRHSDGQIADPTAAQYQGDPLPYERGLGRSCGFMTREPSKPARKILDIIGVRFLDKRPFN